MKDWKNIYLKKHEQNKGWGFSNVIYGRILRFKCNPPLTKEHISELEFLIANYDYHKTLLKRYEPIISNSIKNSWLDKFYESKGLNSNSNHNLHTALIPFYLINPNTNIERIDKDFLNDQILISLNSFDHKFRKYRWRANYLLEFLPIRFMDLKPNLRIKIIEVLSYKTNIENISKINQLIYKYKNQLHVDSISNFVSEQINKDLINETMAIGYLKQFKNFITSEMSDKLIDKIKQLKNSEIILQKIISS